jgi:hypothetical protein
MCVSFSSVEVDTRCFSSHFSFSVRSASVKSSLEQVQECSKSLQQVQVCFSFALSLTLFCSCTLLRQLTVVLVLQVQREQDRRWFQDEFGRLQKVLSERVGQDMARVRAAHLNRMQELYDAQSNTLGTASSDSVSSSAPASTATATVNSSSSNETAAETTTSSATADSTASDPSSPSSN